MFVMIPFKALLLAASIVGSVSASCESNVQPDLERTLRGVLVGGGWRTSGDCDRMTSDDKRNTVIVELFKHSNKNGGYYQGKSDDDLVSIAGGVILLERTGWRRESDLPQMSDDDQRNTLIVELANHDAGKDLQGKSTWELVQLAEDWLHRSCQVSSILSFTWSLDQAKIAATKPEVLWQQTFDNSQSDIPLQNTFHLQQTTTQESSFTYDMGLKFSEKATFSTGIPFVASGHVELSSEQSFSWTWNKKNTQTTGWTNDSPVNVPPRKKLQVIAQVSRSDMDIPYYATVRSDSGNIMNIQGVWSGTSVYNLEVKQIELGQEELEVPVIV